MKKVYGRLAAFVVAALLPGGVAFGQTLDVPAGQRVTATYTFYAAAQ